MHDQLQMASSADIPADKKKNIDFVKAWFTICTIYVFMELKTLLNCLNLPPVKHLPMNINDWL